MNFKPTLKFIDELASDKVLIDFFETDKNRIALTVRHGKVFWNFESTEDNLKEELDETLESIFETKEFVSSEFWDDNLQNIYNFFEAFKNAISL